MKAALVVYWSSEPSLDVDRGRAKISTWTIVVIFACQLVSLVCKTTLLANLHSPYRRRWALWIDVVVDVVLIIAIAVYAVQSRSRTYATRREQDLLEDNPEDLAILTEVTYHDSNTQDRDRGLLTIIDGDLVFVGDRSSSRIALGSVDLTTQPMLNGAHLIVDFPNGDYASFRFLRGRYDPYHKRREAFIRAAKSAERTSAEPLA